MSPRNASNEMGHPDILMAKLGSLIDMIGEKKFLLELARFFHGRVAANHLHVVRVGNSQAARVLSVSYDGSDTASQLTRHFYSRNLNRFEREIMISESPRQAHIEVVSDHTQESLSPEFRSFGREVRVGTRFLIRKNDPDGAIAFSILCPLDRGDLSHLLPDIRRLSCIVAPLVSKHIAICENQIRLVERLNSVSAIEMDLLRILGAERPREARVGAYILAGNSATEIASQLAISPETVTFHRKRLYARLNVQTSRELLLWYIAQNSAQTVPKIAVQHNSYYADQFFDPSRLI